MSILITGASGFIGTHLIERLRRASPVPIVSLGRSAPSMKVDAHLQVDLTHPESSGDLKVALERFKPSAIYHLAGVIHSTPERLFQLNLLATVRLLESIAAANQCPRVLILGSAAEYGYPSPDQLPLAESEPCQPVGPYAVAKFSQTLLSLDYHRRLNIPILIARPFNIVGPGISEALLLGAVLKKGFQAARNGASMIAVGNVDSSRDFVGVGEAARALEAVMSRGVPGEIYNICLGTPVSIRWLIEKTLGLFPRRLNYQSNPSPVRTADPARIYGDPSKINALLGTPIENTLEGEIERAWDHVAAKSGFHADQAFP